MKKFFSDEATLKRCKIYSMLEENAKKRHLSFHTPGHKTGKWDITELSFSDNLSCPRGVIAEAERDISQLLGSERSFILTDGSTAGVLSMLKSSGARSVAVAKNSHKSVFNGCRLLGIKPVLMDCSAPENIPLQPPRGEMNEKLKKADALFLTSPDYYGNIADLKSARELCDEQKKLLLIDGAHGGHLRFDRELYAGTYADLWVDGVHKSLPALTQGAVVSAKTPKLAKPLSEAVDIFRTSSPSYPIMASVEYAVKYPRNEELEKEVLRFVREYPERIYFGGDWTKLCAVFGSRAFELEKRFEARGIYPEFCDGNVVMFYLSPATKKRDFERLKKELISVFSSISSLPCPPRSDQTSPLSKEMERADDTEWIPLFKAQNRICARPCGLFPPCTPLLRAGEKITEEKLSLLQSADNVFGLKDGNLILVFR